MKFLSLDVEFFFFFSFIELPDQYNKWNIELLIQEMVNEVREMSSFSARYLYLGDFFTLSLW